MEDPCVVFNVAGFELCPVAGVSHSIQPYGVVFQVVALGGWVLFFVFSRKIVDLGCPCAG